MKKYVWMAAVLAGALALTGCGGSKKQEEKGNEAAVETEASGKTGSADTDAEEAVSEEAEESILEEASEVAEDVLLAEAAQRPDYTALDYVTVGDYDGLTVTVDEIEISDEEIEDRIADNIKAADLMDEVTEGTVQSGDIANIDYVGKKDDVAFDGGTAEGYDLTIGSGTFIPGFEEGLVDVKIGDTVDLNLTFPEEYPSEELAGADVVFTVTVNSVKRMPELTDALAEQLSGGSDTTMDAYRETVRGDLTDEASQQQENYINNELMVQLFNTCTVDSYPEDLVNYSLKEMKDYYASYAQSQGMDFSEFLQQYFGMDEETFNEEAKTTVESSLQQELILMAVAEKEGLREISDEDYEAGCEFYASQLGYDSADSFKALYDERQIRDSLAIEAALDRIREKAVIVTSEEVEALSEAVTE